MPWRNVDNLAVSIGHLYTQFTQLHIEDMFVIASSYQCSWANGHDGVGNQSSLHVQHRVTTHPITPARTQRPTREGSIRPRAYPIRPGLSLSFTDPRARPRTARSAHALVRPCFARYHVPLNGRNYDYISRPPVRQSRAYPDYKALYVGTTVDHVAFWTLNLLLSTIPRFPSRETPLQTPASKFTWSTYARPDSAQLRTSRPTSLLLSS
ncbi:hypothetical protein PAXINDRAFT_22147 [Paxillus involutus ATCC 200175]|uniref:Uncharacterized protein n=1 Tax=Paxillus involutus ATCC 200175 TaxID=664439 RepID=A0A0C9SLK0_PAXIN|nr:hypothetical protein PAXINDRAFT_22147 [Paxillus involutus ATCC 200175]